MFVYKEEEEEKRRKIVLESKNNANMEGNLSKSQTSKSNKSLKSKQKRSATKNANVPDEIVSDGGKRKAHRSDKTVNLVPANTKGNLKPLDSTDENTNLIGLNPSTQSKSGNGNEPASNTTNQGKSTNSKMTTRPYVGFEAHSVTTIWEQHNNSDMELAPGVCERIAEDLSYKVWELISHIKSYARHSGGRLTAAIVNEVLLDHDVPPALGAVDSDWDCIKCDGVFYFHPDKVLELRDEYQKDVTIEMPSGADFQCSWPLEMKCNDMLKKYITNLIYACANGDAEAFDVTLKEVSYSPIIGAAYRMLLAKVIQILAFKQHDELSSKIWRFLRACSSNQYARDLVCREEYLHLAEILICQLLATNESIKLELDNEIKLEMNDIDMEVEHAQGLTTSNSNATEERVYRLIPEEDDKEEESSFFSPYFATPVHAQYVDELCDCLGQLASISAYFQNECTVHIFKRLDLLFQQRQLNSDKEFIFLRRAIRGCIALGEYAFREFIPYIYKLPSDDIPDYLWNDLATSALYLKGSDDIFLYEWLSHVCGANKLLPFMTYFAQYNKKLMACSKQHAKKPTYYINPKVSIRHIRWFPSGAQNKHEYHRSTMFDYFPKLVAPKRNKPTSIGINLPGFQSVSIQRKGDFIDQNIFNRPLTYAANPYDVIIARRRLLKPLTNESKRFGINQYHFLTI